MILQNILMAAKAVRECNQFCFKLFTKHCLILPGTNGKEWIYAMQVKNAEKNSSNKS